MAYPKSKSEAEKIVLDANGTKVRYISQINGMITLCKEKWYTVWTTSQWSRFSKCTFELNYDNAVKPVKRIRVSKKA